MDVHLDSSIYANSRYFSFLNKPTGWVRYLYGTQLVTHLKFWNVEGQKRCLQLQTGQIDGGSKSAMDVASRRLHRSSSTVPQSSLSIIYTPGELFQKWEWELLASCFLLLAENSLVKPCIPPVCLVWQEWFLCYWSGIEILHPKCLTLPTATTTIVTSDCCCHPILQSRPSTKALSLNHRIQTLSIPSTPLTQTWERGSGWRSLPHWCWRKFGSNAAVVDIAWIFL